MSDPAHKVLIICPRVPWPAEDGESIAILRMIRAYYLAGHELSIFCMNPRAQNTKLDTLPEEMQEWGEWLAADVDADSRQVDRLANLIFGRNTYDLQRYQSSGFLKSLEAFLQKGELDYDWVHFETLRTCYCVNTVTALMPDAWRIYRMHRLENLAVEERLAKSKNPFKEFYLGVTAKRLKRIEKELVKSKDFDALVPVNTGVASWLKKIELKIPVYHFPVGYDPGEVSAVAEPDETQSHSALTLFYWGALRRPSNRRAIQSFLSGVWPQLQQRFPQLRLHIGGEQMPEEFVNLTVSGVTFEAEYEDRIAFFASHDIMILPAQSGDDMRPLLAQGLVTGKTMVASGHAVKGYKLKHGQHLMIAANDKEFEEGLKVLLESPGMREVLGKNARDFAVAMLDEQKNMAGLRDFVLSLKREEEKDEEESEA